MPFIYHTYLIENRVLTMASNNKNLLDYIKISSSDYVKITLEYMLQSLHREHMKANPELSKEINAVLNTISSKPHLTMAELKTSHSQFSPQLTQLVKQKIAYSNAHKLQEAEPVTAAIMGQEKPAVISKPEPPIPQNTPILG